MYVIAMVKNMVIRLVLGLDSKQLTAEQLAEQDCSVTSVVQLEVAELICTRYVTFHGGPLIILLI